MFVPGAFGCSPFGISPSLMMGSMMGMGMGANLAMGMAGVTMASVGIPMAMATMANSMPLMGGNMGGYAGSMIGQGLGGLLGVSEQNGFRLGFFVPSGIGVPVDDLLIELHCPGFPQVFHHDSLRVVEVD